MASLIRQTITSRPLVGVHARTIHTHNESACVVLKRQTQRTHNTQTTRHSSNSITSSSSSSSSAVSSQSRSRSMHMFSPVSYNDNTLLQTSCLSHKHTRSCGCYQQRMQFSTKDDKSDTNAAEPIVEEKEAAVEGKPYTEQEDEEMDTQPSEEDEETATVAPAIDNVYEETGGENDDVEESDDEESDIDEDDDDALASLKPKEIVDQLDKYIIGQDKAKKAVALALRNRWRRKQLDEELSNDVVPKNILMVGPTGCGKTEIARRLAKLANAPFIKVEATKYTEMGFHGRDVDTIIRDLVENAISLVRTRKKAKSKKKIDRNVENRILDALIGKGGDKRSIRDFREHYRRGDLDDQDVNIEVPVVEPANGPPAGLGGEYSPFNQSIVLNLTKQLGGYQKKPTEKRRMKISECRPMIEEMEAEKLMSADDVTKEALELTQQDGIVFLDEIDKICSARDKHGGADASAEGVQRDLLPLIEGSSVTTKHGNVDTDHILFICSGAFHSCKPSDLLAELQGRLPIRVELKGLTENDFYRILTEPVTNLVRQQKSLIGTEDINLEFEDAGIKEIAKVSFEVNTAVENIGARRLHTIMEKVMEDISFNAPEMDQTEDVTIDATYVRERVGDILVKTDLSKFIL